jgi:all-trans-retinol dehydrogenase (NAD+)
VKLEGRRVLVTGGAQGMGLLVACGAAARGAHVAVWDLDSKAIPDAVARISAAGAGGDQRVASDAVDVGDPDAVASAAERLEAAFGKVDVLVNNAGVVSGKRLTELAPEEVQRTLRVNTAALFWTTRSMLPAMIDAGEGHVVTMASAGGLIGVAGLSDYCASKFGAVGFHESLRAELRRTAPGVGTSLICPFFVGTGMFAGVRSRFPFLLPILEPESVAAAVIRAVERNRAVVVLPWFVHSLKLLRLLPVRWLDPIASFFGIHAAMDTFSGRPKPS